MNSKKRSRNGIFAAFLLTTTLACTAQKIEYPETKKSLNETTYHGVTIKDDFSWLDDVNSDQVKAWTKTQDDFTQSYVRSIPGYETLKTKIGTLMQVAGRTQLPMQTVSHYFFVQANDQGTGVLYKQKKEGDKEALPLPFDARAATFILPSPDASHLALAMARPGGYYDWKVYSVADQKLLEATMQGGKLGNTRLTWSLDGSGFYYTAMDADADQNTPRTNKRIKYHKVGTEVTTDMDVYIPESEGTLWDINVSDDNQYLVIAERQGAATAGTVRVIHTSGPDKQVKSIVDKAEASYIFLGNDGPKFYFQTDLGAPNGKIVSVNIDQPTRVWMDLVPEGEIPMMGFQSAGGTLMPLMAGNKFVVPVQEDLIISLKIYGLDGKEEGSTILPAGGLYFQNNGLNALSGSRTSNMVMTQFIGITEPNTIFNINVNNAQLGVFARAKVNFNADDYESEIAFTTSKDGTRIPISLTYKKGLKKNGKNFLMMQVYGALGFSNYPYFQGDYMAWLEMGGIHAVAHIRGGGVFGSQWHQDGIARNKQNGTDDYIAALEWAIDKKYTSKKRTVLNGVSAGTIPIGAVMTQRPDLIGAVVSHYGMLDMIGYAEKLGEDANHGYMLPEIGKSSDPDDFKVLNAYSPYQKLKKGTKYPPVLALTSEADGPLNSDSYKYIAWLQQTNRTNPMLLQMAWGSGHSMFGSQQHSPVLTFSDEIAFLIKAMEIDVEDWLGTE